MSSSSTPPPDDPFAPSDATALRPSPGRRVAAPPPQGSPGSVAAPASPGPQSARPGIQTPARALPQSPPDAPGTAPGFDEFMAASSDPILQAAVPLLILAARLRGQISSADLESLRRQCIEEMRAFETRLRVANLPAEDVLAARYALCTAVDEAVMNTPWGAQSSWARQSLLVTFHREADGGAKFFLILERLLTEPQRYAGLLELLYACLALGFEGRHRLDERGTSRLDDIRRELYRQIERQRGSFEPELSPRWKGVEDRRNAVLRLVPLWVVAAACGALLIGTYLFLHARLNIRAATVSATLAGIGLERPELSAAPRQPAGPSGIAALLAPETARGTLQVAELGDRTLITVTVPQLFASGSARVNPRYVELLHEVGRALNGVPGRIVVTGHTDDQPVRSFQFADNYALSRARAVYVTELLKRDVADSSRMMAIGKGDSEPLAKPVDLPENRARNRRVEIVLLRGE
jgi:type VI secretion system protein ImpK